MSLTSLLVRQKVACPLASSLRSLSLSCQLDNAAAAAQSKIPKRPASPWIRYFTANYPHAKKANPNLKVSQHMKDLSIKWNALPDGQKAKFVTDYEKEKESYKKKMAKVPEADLEEKSKESAKKRLTKVKNIAQTELKELLDSLKKPARPLGSGYLVYSIARQPAYREKGMTVTEASKAIAAEWKTLSEQQKQTFIKKADGSKQKYEQDIAAWTNKVKKMGKLEQVMDAEAKLAQAKKKLKDLDI